MTPSPWAIAPGWGPYSISASRQSSSEMRRLAANWSALFSCRVPCPVSPWTAWPSSWARTLFSCVVLMSWRRLIFAVVALPAWLASVVVGEGVTPSVSAALSSRLRVKPPFPPIGCYYSMLS